LLAALCAAVVAEGICRWGIGLGDPPLYRADPKLEYVLRPSRTYHRFHHRIHINSYGMRADDFPAKKARPDELRILVVGDSIVFGGSAVDQSALATERLKETLKTQLGAPIVVGNASAKSWGPPNELEYLRRYGTLDSDVVILELSSHDYADAPTFEPLVGMSPEYPAESPFFALSDLLSSYVVPRLRFDRAPSSSSATSQEPSRAAITACLAAERDFFRLARSGGAVTVLVQHWTKSEIDDGTPLPGHGAIRAVAEAEHVPTFEDVDELRALLDRGEQPFLDDLHLGAAGQAALGHVLRSAVRATMRPPS
jgi:hypothetical protein